MTKREKTIVLTYFESHVVVGGSIEVGVGPLGEGVLLVLFCCSVIGEREFGVGLEELGLLHLL